MDGDGASEHAHCLRTTGELVRALMKLVDGKSVHDAFGAPGDWGYETEIGAELYAYYNSAEVIERRARDAELIADLRQAIDDVKIVRRVDGDGMEFGSIRKLDDVERSLAAAIAAIQGAQP